MIEQIAEHNVKAFTGLVLRLWPESNYEEEYQHGREMIQSERETAFLYKTSREYIGFITLSMRYEYVEGTHTKPVGYVEGIWVQTAYRKVGIGRKLVEMGERWCREKGCVEMASDAELHNITSQFFHKHIGFEEVNRIVCYRKDLGNRRG